MAKTLNLHIGTIDVNVSPVKVERKKLYGYTEVRGVDLNTGKICQQVGLNGNGVTIIPKGATKVGMLCEGNWMEREELKAIHTDGSIAEKIPSTFDATVNLCHRVDEEELLDIIVCSVYQLTGDETDTLAKEIGTDIYTFPFVYTASYTEQKAFLLSKDNDCFLIIGEPAEFEIIGLDEQATLDDNTTDDDNNEEEFEFGMF